MKKYKVRKIYQYSEEVFVDAESTKEAKDLAMQMEGERIYDDTLYDCEATLISQEEDV